MCDLKLLKPTCNEDLLGILELYRDAFPAEERREPEQLQNFLDHQYCCIYTIKVGEQIAGLCILWHFKYFMFLEHFAIMESMRGKKIGEKVLAYLQKEFEKPLIFEVEPPVDEMSQRRVAFYIRNGFSLYNKKYIQPSYDGVKPDINLNLMGSEANLGCGKLDGMIKIVHREVYGKK